MTDFLIHELAWYPWLAWPLAFLALVGVVYGCLWVAGIVTFCSSWMAHKREAWRYKDAVMRELREGDDPPEYQHPDGDDDLWDEPGDDWSPTLAWGPPEPMPAREMAGLAEVLSKAKAMGLLDDEPVRCNNADCYLYGVIHNGPCDVSPTMPAACYPPMRLTDPGRPAGPPIPWSELDKALPLLPAVRADLEAAGFGGHEYVEDVAESAYTAAQAAEVQAQLRELER